MIYALVVLVRNIRTAVKIKTNSHHNKRQTKVHGLPFVTYYNLMFLNKSPRLVPMLSDLGMTTFSSGSSLTTSSRAFMLRLILPSLMPITFTFTSSPTFKTSFGDLTRFWLIWDTWTSPDRPSSRRTKAP